MHYGKTKLAMSFTGFSTHRSRKNIQCSCALHNFMKLREQNEKSSASKVQRHVIHKRQLSIISSPRMSGNRSDPSDRPQVIYSNEVTRTQEALVRKSLETKALIEEFHGIRNNSTMESINGLIRGGLEEIRCLLEDLRRLSRSQTDPEARNMLRRDVETHSSQLESIQTAFKVANLSCIREMERLRRNELIPTDEDNLSNRKVRKRNPKEPLDILKETGGVTDRLNSIARQLSTTVERSSLTLSELTESSQTITETGEEFKGMGAILGQSRKLITKYTRREVTDRILIFFATAFFFSIVLYIVRKRMFP